MIHIYGLDDQLRVPEDIEEKFPRVGQFGYEMITLRLRAVCDSTQDRDSMYKQAKDTHSHVGAVGPPQNGGEVLYGIYW